MRAPNLTFARFTGIAYLCIAFLGGFAFFSMSERLHVSGDALATAQNIADNLSLFRAGLAAYLLTLVLDVLVAWMLYCLFVDAGGTLTRLLIWMRLAYVYIHGAAILELVAILHLVGVDGGSAAGNATAIAGHMQQHLDGFLLSLILFGMHLVLLGGLIVRCAEIPRIIGVLLIGSGLAYIIDGFAFVLLADYAAFYDLTQTAVATVAVLGEFSLLLWLLFRGTRSSRSARVPRP